jgi:spore germination protein YaaH
MIKIEKIVEKNTYMVESKKTFYTVKKEDSSYNVTVVNDFNLGKESWTIIDFSGNEVKDQNTVEEIVSVIQVLRNDKLIDNSKIY